MTAFPRVSFRAVFIACATLLLASPAAAQCWSGGTTGQGVPRESLFVTNSAPFPVNVMAGPAGGARRVLGQVPAGTTMSFASVLPPGRNETTVWVDPADQEKYKLASARTSGVIVIANRRDLTCRRAARLEITPSVFEAGAVRRNTNVARGTDLSRLAPAAGPRAAGPRRAAVRPAARPPAATTPANSMVGRQPGPPTGAAGVVRY
jgi:hypothetical protein